MERAANNWRRLVEQAQAGDKGAKEKLLEENSGLIYMVLKRFAGQNHDMEELYQVGAIGLIRAIDKFDLSTEYKLSTYAVPMIIGEIRRFLRDDGTIHVSRQIKENARQIAAVRDRWKKEHGSDISLQELVARTGLAKEDVLLALDANAVVESIYRPVGNQDSHMGDVPVTLADQLEDQDAADTRLLDHILVREMLAGLPERDRRLLGLRYMAGHTQSETARMLGMNQVAVSRHEKRILQELRQKYQ